MPSTNQPFLSSPCLICGEPTLLQVREFAALPRITSDCRPFATGGALAVCQACASVQKIPDTRWLSEIASIYSDYAAYSLAGGEEQLVLDPQSGQPRKRSDVLMRALLDTGELPRVARALDVGCGHGVTLQAMSIAFPNWELFGHELDESKKASLLAIRAFQHLYTGELSTIDGTFDFISMIHSIEHFIDPLQTLRSLKKVGAKDGHLFIEVCNVEENPFDLLVTDHLTHFSPATLAFAVSRAGYSVSRVTTDWVRKEVSLLARMDGKDDSRIVPAADAGRTAYAGVSASVSWLGTLISAARATASESASFGIFGTSIAGTWLATALGDQVKFFVDEDPNRIGREYLGKPVLAPQSVAPGSTVFLALAPTLAQAIKRRLSGLSLNLATPPEVSA
jgi:SAM-dependent methyltransferase